MRLLLAVAALSAALPAGAASATCTNDLCAVECAAYVVRHLDPWNPSLICPM